MKNLVSFLPASSRRADRLLQWLGLFVALVSPASATQYTFNTAGDFAANFSEVGASGYYGERATAGIGSSRAIHPGSVSGSATAVSSQFVYDGRAQGTDQFAAFFKWQANTNPTSALGIMIGLVSDPTADMTSTGDALVIALRAETTSNAVQLAVRSRESSTNTTPAFGDDVTLTVGHWYQLSGTISRYNQSSNWRVTCDLQDWGTGGATEISALQHYETTIENIPLSTDSTVYPGFRAVPSDGINIIDNVTIANSPVVISTDEIWTDGDVGSPAIAGDYTYTNSGGLALTVSAAGSGLGGTADQFYFLHQKLSGDGQVAANVTGLGGASSSTQGGLICRESLDADSRFVGVSVSADGNQQFQSRATTGGTITTSATARSGSTIRLRLSRSGSAWTGEISSDGGSTWSSVGSTTLALSSEVVAGLATSSCDVATSTTLGYDGVVFGGPTTASISPTVRALDPNFSGMNSNLVRAGNWSDTSLQSAATSLSPGLIRYPGGTLSGYWDWTTGWFQSGVTLPTQFTGLTENDYTLDDLKTACDATGAEPIYVLNMLNSDLSTQLAMLEYADSIGLPVTRVELGNEYYTDGAVGADFAAKWATGTDFATECNTWMTTIRTEFPSVKFAAPITSQFGFGQTREATWNSQLYSALSGIDAFVVHAYSDTGMDDGASISGNSGTTTQQDNAYTNLQELAPGGIRQVLGMPFVRWNTANQFVQPGYPSGSPVPKLWVTEFNLDDNVGPLRSTWGQGLAAASAFLHFLDEPLIDHAILHNLYTNSRYAAIFSDTNAFFGQVRDPASVQYGLSAAGQTTALAMQAVRGCQSAQALTFDVNPALQGYSGVSYPSLQGWSFYDSGSSLVSAVVINASDRQYTTTLPMALSTFGFVTRTMEPLSIVTGASGEVVETSGTPISSVIVLPPYSITLLHP